MGGLVGGLEGTGHSVFNNPENVKEWVLSVLLSESVCGCHNIVRKLPCWPVNTPVCLYRRWVYVLSGGSQSYGWAGLFISIQWKELWAVFFFTSDMKYI